MMQRSWRVAGLAGALGVALLLGGCGDGNGGSPIGNERPTVDLSARPQPLSTVKYSVRLQWFAFDSDGQVRHFIYAVDPPAQGDTLWTRIARSELTLFFTSSTPDSASIVVTGDQFPGTLVNSTDYHVFVIKAIDNEGAASPPTFVAFTSTTVAPVTTITDPIPSRQTTAITTPSVIFRWNGEDQDGVITQRPVKYKFKLVSQSAIQKALNLGSRDASQEDIQKFFFQDAPTFASWDSVPPESTFKQYEALTAGQIYFFAVTAFDEAGAFEPRFNRNNNVVRLKPSTALQAPILTVYNSYFQRSQPVGAFDLSEDRVVRLEVPEGQPVPFFWDAAAVAGTLIAGYRWALDIEDVFDETSRDFEGQTNRWSSWSVSEKSAIVGPFFVEADTDFTVSPPEITVRDLHRIYIETRDNVGTVSIIVVEMRAVPPAFKHLPPKILVVDDYRGNTDRLGAAPYQPYASFPTEAVLDTLLFAIGGVPYRYRPEGTTSLPGVFAGFDYDTLDYRFTISLLPGVPLSTLTLYSAVVWYCGLGDAGRSGDKTSPSPSGALRLINKLGELNTLAVYLQQGGSGWLFGDGIARGVANGYVSRFGQTTAFLPMTSGGTRPSRDNILWPGNFLYDYMKIRSQMDLINYGGAGNPLSDEDNLVEATPYLPDYRCPGAPWPPDGWTGTPGPGCDPRVGPSSSRHVGRWAGLPRLTFSQEYPGPGTPGWPSSFPQSSEDVPYISMPNIIEEPEAPAPNRQSVLDTLYLYRAKKYLLRQARDNPDGKPIWLHYWGAQHGQLNWTSMPLWLFDRTQLRTVADKVLGQFGFTRRADPRTWTGPGRATERWDEYAGTAHEREGR